MVELWYAILTFMLIMFIVLEGFDIGAGMLQCLVGKTDSERRTVIAAIGPLWSWHEVWLVGFGGTLMLAFPTILAASFAGCYLALFLLVWCLLLRGIALEVSGLIADQLWRSAWHFLFVVSNLLLAILIGAALGNLMRGFPLGAEGKFALAFFTDFSPHGKVGILDWYTTSVAVFMLATLAAHGANGLAHKTEGLIHERSLRMAKSLWKIVLILLGVVTFESSMVRPGLFAGMIQHPFSWFGLAGVFTGITAIFAGLQRDRGSWAILGSSMFIAGLMTAGAAAVFPVMLQSTLAPEDNLTAYNSAADGYGLAVAIVWWPMALVFAIGYLLFIYRHYRGKIRPAEDNQNPY